MENEIKIFKNQEFGQLRTIVKDGEPWFVAKDVCDKFGETNYRRSIRYLDEDEKGVSQINTPGGNQNMTVVNEAGLYSMLFAMQPQKARGVSQEYIAQRAEQLRRFKRWVTHDVIPSIRKTGGYVANDNLFIDTYLPFADDNTKLLFRNTLGVIRKQNKLIEQQKPLVGFAKQVGNSKNTIDIGQLAKLAQDEHIKIGRNRLFVWLRNKKILDHKNLPYQQYIDRGYFEVIEVPRDTPYGVISFQQTRVTGTGQIYIVEKLRKEFGISKS